MVTSPDFVPWMNTLNREDDPLGEIVAELPTRMLDMAGDVLSPAELEQMLAEDRQQRAQGDHRRLVDLGIVERKFNPTQPRDPGGDGGGQWVKSPTSAVKAALKKVAESLDDDDDDTSFVDRLGRALTGQDALDATPATLIPAPNGHSGDYSGGKLDGPPGMGSVRALSEYEGLEYQTTNTTLRKAWRKPETPEDFRRYAEREAEVAARAAEIDKTMAVSRLTDDVQVHRVVKNGSTVFGRDIWYGDIIDWNTTDFDEMDRQEERWIAGERPDLTGLEWREDAYSSTTVDPAVVEHYAKRFDATKSALSGGAVVLNILAPKGTGAIQMSGLGNRQEAELLLERGLRMRVVKDHGEDEKGRRILDIEVIAGG